MKVMANKDMRAGPARNIISCCRILLAMLWLAMLIVPAAAIQNAGELLSACEDFERSVKDKGGGQLSLPLKGDVYTCFGFMNAIQDLSVLLNSDTTRLLGSCPPPSSRVSQLIRVFTNYARKHPETLHEKAGDVAVLALQNAFPCRQLQQLPQGALDPITSPTPQKYRAIF